MFSFCRILLKRAAGVEQQYRFYCRQRIEVTRTTCLAACFIDPIGCLESICMQKPCSICFCLNLSFAIYLHVNQPQSIRIIQAVLLSTYRKDGSGSGTHGFCLQPWWSCTKEAMSSTIGLSNTATVRDQPETQRRLGEHRIWEVNEESGWFHDGVVSKGANQFILGEESQHLDHLELSIYIPQRMRFLKHCPFLPQCIVNKQVLPAWHRQFRTSNKNSLGVCRSVFAWQLRGKFSYFYSDALVEQQSQAIVLRNWRRTWRQALPLPCPLWNSFTNGCTIQSLDVFWNAATETNGKVQK